MSKASEEIRDRIIGLEAALADINIQLQRIETNLLRFVENNLLRFVTEYGRNKGLAICSACAEQYDPSRKPAEGRSNYCDAPECKRESARRRKLKSRPRKSGGRASHRTPEAK
jgi:hypothetical protein